MVKVKSFLVYFCSKFFTAKMKRMERLSRMALGQSGVIKEYDDEYAKVKLMEMGCLPGEWVSVENIAPFGDPMVIKVAGYKLSLRKADAASIWVEV